MRRPWETIALAEIDDRRALRLSGDVRLENNGGFIQAALDLAPEGQTHSGVWPWQSYRAGFVAVPEWREIRLPFASFEPHRLSEPLSGGHRRRIGLVVIGPGLPRRLAVSFYG